MVEQKQAEKSAEHGRAHEVVDLVDTDQRVGARGKRVVRTGRRAGNRTTQFEKDEFILLLAGRRHAGASPDELAAEFSLGKSRISSLVRMEATARARVTRRALGAILCWLRDGPISNHIIVEFGSREGRVVTATGDKVAFGGLAKTMTNKEGNEHVRSH